MSTIIAIILSAYILGCVVSLAINLYDFIKHADDYPDILAGIIISVLTCTLSWISVGAFICWVIKRNKARKDWKTNKN